MSTTENITVLFDANGAVNTTAMATNFVANIDADSSELTQVTDYLNTVGRDVLVKKYSVLFLLEATKLLKNY